MRIIKTEIKYSTPFIQMNQTTFLDNNNQEKKWDWVERTGNKKAVMIVPCIHGFCGDDRLILIKEKRIPLNDFEYGFPAGLIDENETVLSAIERELKEETGYTVKYLREVSPFVYNSAGLTNESISIAFVTVEEKYKEQKLELTEEIEVLELNKNQILDLLKDSNNKFGAKAWLILNSFVNGFLPF